MQYAKWSTHPSKMVNSPEAEADFRLGVSARHQVVLFRFINTLRDPRSPERIKGLENNHHVQRSQISVDPACLFCNCARRALS